MATADKPHDLAATVGHGFRQLHRPVPDKEGVMRGGAFLDDDALGMETRFPAGGVVLVAKVHDVAAQAVRHRGKGGGKGRCAVVIRRG
nr:hypothetical protein [Novacetimonas hansenii]